MNTLYRFVLKRNEIKWIPKPIEPGIFLNDLIAYSGSPNNAYTTFRVKFVGVQTRLSEMADLDTVETVSDDVFVSVVRSLTAQQTC